MSVGYSAFKPYLLQATYQGAYLKKPPAKPIDIKATFDPYYKVGASIVVVYGVNAFRASAPAIHNQLTYTAPSGFSNSDIGTPSIRNNAVIIFASSISPNTIPFPTIYSLTSYIKTIGINDIGYGIAYVQGGIKTVTPYGLLATIFGAATTGLPFAKPSGFVSSLMGVPTVRPYIVYPTGIEHLKIGTHKVGFQPTIRPDGYSQTLWGNTTVWYHTRPLSPTAINSMDMGYPIVFDPAQEVQAPSLIASAIFGDTYVKNYNSIIRASSIITGAFSDYTVLTNLNRHVSVKSIDSSAIGAVAIRNKTPSIFVEGIANPNFNQPAIGYRQRTVVPTGFDRLIFGRPTLTKTPQLFPRAFQSSVVGSGLTVTYKNRAFEMAGFDALVVGENKEQHIVWFRQRKLSPTSWSSSNLTGRTILTHYLRELISKGYEATVYGRPWVSAGQRVIEPQGIYKNSPSNHLVGRLQTISVEGYIATLFGTRIIPESQSVYPLGFIGTFGDTVIGFHTRHLRPIGFSIDTDRQISERWGIGHVFNSVQYITQEFDVSSGLVPPPWSDYMLIENRNKSIGPVGFVAQKFGYSVASNNATPLLPVGIEPPVSGRFEQALIAHAVRIVALDGIEPPQISPWLAIYNAARLLAPNGINESLVCNPSVISNRRYFNGIGRFESLVISQPMVSHAIRFIDIEPRYSIFPPQINLPVISNYVKYVEVVGLDTLSTGLPDLVERFNIIGPKWKYNYNMGDPYIRNSTPEVAPYGHDSNEFGDTKIRTQWRRVTTAGDTATLWGKPSVLDRKQTVVPLGWRDTISNQKLVVTRLGAPPYSEQKIDLQGGGIKVPDVSLYYLQVPRPVIKQNIIYVENDKPWTIFGAPVVTANSIRIMNGIGEFKFSSNARVELKDRAVQVSAISSVVSVGSPRLSPWTIYTGKNPPVQAIKNHVIPALSLHDVDYFTSKGVGIAIGYPTVTNQNRIAYVRSNEDRNGLAMGMPRVWLGKQFINLHFEGVPAGRFGTPKIPFTDQYIISFSQSHDSLEMGVIKIESLRYDVDRAGGIGSPAMPKHEIMLKHRKVAAIGLSSLAMGTKLSNDRPYMWQGLRIGEYVDFIFNGFDAARYGTAFISYRVRGIELEGFDTFRSEYDINNFIGRMRVTKTPLPPPPASTIIADGFDAYLSGITSLKHGQYFIRPDGNSDQFRKGGYHA